MNWREPTDEDIHGKGEHRYILDIAPDVIPHQATNDGDTLIRIGIHGWFWMIKDFGGDEISYPADGCAPTREEAIGAAMDALAKLRSG